MEPLLLIQTHRTQGGTLTVRFPGARIAPIKSTWAYRQTRLENNGANGAKTRIIPVGRVRESFTSLDGSVTSVPYPFLPQMAKVQLRACADRERISR